MIHHIGTMGLSYLNTPIIDRAHRYVESVMFNLFIIVVSQYEQIIAAGCFGCHQGSFDLALPCLRRRDIIRYLYGLQHVIALTYDEITFA